MQFSEVGHPAWRLDMNHHEISAGWLGPTKGSDKKQPYPTEISHLTSKEVKMFTDVIDQAEVN